MGTPDDEDEEEARRIAEEEILKEGYPIRPSSSDLSKPPSGTLLVHSETRTNEYPFKTYSKKIEIYHGQSKSFEFEELKAGDARIHVYDISEEVIRVEVGFVDERPPEFVIREAARYAVDPNPSNKIPRVEIEQWTSL